MIFVSNLHPTTTRRTMLPVLSLATTLPYLHIFLSHCAAALHHQYAHGNDNFCVLPHRPLPVSISSWGAYPHLFLPPSLPTIPPNYLSISFDATQSNNTKSNASTRGDSRRQHTIVDAPRKDRIMLQPHHHQADSVRLHWEVDIQRSRRIWTWPSTSAWSRRRKGSGTWRVSSRSGMGIFWPRSSIPGVWREMVSCWCCGPDKNIVVNIYSNLNVNT